MPTTTAFSRAQRHSATLLQLLSLAPRVFSRSRELSDDGGSGNWVLHRRNDERFNRIADGFRPARALLRHQIPNGDPAAVVERALTVLVEQLEKVKYASTRTFPLM